MLHHKIHLIVIVAVASFLLSCTATKFLPKPVAPPLPKPVVVIDTIVKPAIPLIADNSKTDSFMRNLLQQYPQYFDSIITNRKALNVQIIYTQIDRGANGIPVLKNHYFNVDSSSYFYPASTVKFPISLLALQRLNELKASGVNIDKNTTMITGQAYSGQTAVLNDPTTIDGKPNIAQYIKKMMLVSDNDAFNRLYEFLGPQYINEQLQQKGHPASQINHRLQIALSEDENRHTNPVQFLHSSNQPLYEQPMKFYTAPYPARKDSIGKGYVIAGKIVDKPMDFSTKNRLALQDLHSILVSLIFPEKVTGSQRFNLTEEDRRFVMKYMSQLPTESTFPPYSDDTAKYYPAYCKFLLMGSQKGELPKNIRIFNKVGDAYGQVIDVAYIVDFDKKIEFFVSAAIYCNSDGILNDDRYDYESIGFPFMKNLGQVIYEHELKREKKLLPDLESLKFEYDKK